MSIISVKAPLKLDETYGYAGNDNYNDVVKQNLKMLILTAPGERVMIPNFGVGLYRFLFEPMGPETNGEIASRIRQQVKLFMSFLKIGKINFNQSENALFIQLKYFIIPLGVEDVLDINVNI